jgi:hypothetical protein
MLPSFDMHFISLMEADYFCMEQISQMKHPYTGWLSAVVNCRGLRQFEAEKM